MLAVWNLATVSMTLHRFCSRLQPPRLSLEPCTKEPEWVDSGYVSTNVPEEDAISSGSTRYTIPQLDELYGDVASYLYVLKTTMNSEHKVASEIQARLSGTGSLQDIKSEIFGVHCPKMMQGYIVVEASALHHVEKLIGRAGGHNPTQGLQQGITGAIPLGNIAPYLEPKSATAGIEEGDIVEIRASCFQGRASSCHQRG